MQDNDKDMETGASNTESVPHTDSPDECGGCDDPSFMQGWTVLDSHVTPAKWVRLYKCTNCGFRMHGDETKRKRIRRSAPYQPRREL